MVERLRCHVTVAAVIEREGRYLFVEERVAGQRVLNQPAGHLEAGEDLRQAVIREVREETGFEFIPEAWLGLRSAHPPRQRGDPSRGIHRERRRVADAGT